MRSRWGTRGVFCIARLISSLQRIVHRGFVLRRFRHRSREEKILADVLFTTQAKFDHSFISAQYFDDRTNLILFHHSDVWSRTAWVKGWKISLNLLFAHANKSCRPRKTTNCQDGEVWLRATRREISPWWVNLIALFKRFIGILSSAVPSPRKKVLTSGSI